MDYSEAGGGSPEIPRQSLHKRHPLYPVILGVSDGLIPTEASEGTKICPDPGPSTQRPLQTPSAQPNACPQETPAPQQGP